MITGTFFLQESHGLTVEQYLFFNPHIIFQVVQQSETIFEEGVLFSLKTPSTHA